MASKRKFKHGDRVKLVAEDACDNPPRKVIGYSNEKGLVDMVVLESVTEFPDSYYLEDDLELYPDNDPYVPKGHHIYETLDGAEYRKNNEESS